MLVISLDDSIRTGCIEMTCGRTEGIVSQGHCRYKRDTNRLGRCVTGLGTESGLDVADTMSTSGVVSSVSIVGLVRTMGVVDRA